MCSISSFYLTGSTCLGYIYSWCVQFFMNKLILYLTWLVYNWVWSVLIDVWYFRSKATFYLHIEKFVQKFVFLRGQKVPFFSFFFSSLFSENKVWKHNQFCNCNQTSIIVLFIFNFVTFKNPLLVVLWESTS